MEFTSHVVLKDGLIVFKRKDFCIPACDVKSPYDLAYWLLTISEKDWCTKQMINEFAWVVFCYLSDRKEK